MCEGNLLKLLLIMRMNYVYCNYDSVVHSFQKEGFSTPLYEVHAFIFGKHLRGPFSVYLCLLVTLRQTVAWKSRSIVNQELPLVIRSIT